MRSSTANLSRRHRFAAELADLERLLATVAALDAAYTVTDPREDPRP